MSKPANPPAFPRPDSHIPGQDVQFGAKGMTLRDYFAAAVISGQAANPHWTGSIEACAKEAYTQADAMLTEREKGRGAQ